jgi:AcrR family transcriptional regulator
MGRWEPDAQQRLQRAAMELFAERGYGEVTVDEIARRAGLTKRSFFNHFSDKREVLFADAKDFEADVIRYLSEAGPGLAPVDAAIRALTRAGQDLARYGNVARFRRDLIASSTELQERNLIKMAALTSAIADTLSGPEIPARTAAFAAHAAVTVFGAAYDEWADDTTADFPALMHRALSDMSRAVSPDDRSNSELTDKAPRLRTAR